MGNACAREELIDGEGDTGKLITGRKTRKSVMHTDKYSERVPTVMEKEEEEEWQRDTGKKRCNRKEKGKKRWEADGKRGKRSSKGEKQRTGLP